MDTGTIITILLTVFGMILSAGIVIMIYILQIQGSRLDAAQSDIKTMLSDIIK